MIDKLTSYRIKCDVAGCPKSTGAKSTEQEVVADAIRLAWQRCGVPGLATELFRCPKCVVKELYPEGWQK